MNADGNSAQVSPGRGISRRLFLKAGIMTAVAGSVPCNALAAAEAFLTDKRALSFYNLQTKEYLETVYWKHGQHVTSALDDINHIMRDHYCGVVKPIDTTLLDLFFAIRERLHCSEPFLIISGYRTSRTNDMLRKRNKGAAKNSLHMHGKAADIRLEGQSLRSLRRAAYELKAGGVGYYPRSNFVHVDVGDVRYW